MTATKELQPETAKTRKRVPQQTTSPDQDPSWLNGAKLTSGFDSTGTASDRIGFMFGGSIVGPNVGSDFLTPLDAAYRERLADPVQQFAATFLASQEGEAASRLLNEYRARKRSAREAREQLERMRPEYTAAIASGDSEAAERLRVEIEANEAKALADEKLADGIRSAAQEQFKLARRTMRARAKLLASRIRFEASQERDRLIEALFRDVARKVFDIFVVDRIASAIDTSSDGDIRLDALAGLADDQFENGS